MKTHRSVRMRVLHQVTAGALAASLVALFQGGCSESKVSCGNAVLLSPATLALKSASPPNEQFSKYAYPAKRAF